MTSIMEALADFFESFDELALLAPNGVLVDTSTDSGTASVTGGEITESETDITGLKTDVYSFELNLSAPAVTHAQRCAAHTALDILYNAVCDAANADVLPEFDGKICDALEAGAPTLETLDDSGKALYTLPLKITLSERN